MGSRFNCSLMLRSFANLMLRAFAILTVASATPLTAATEADCFDVEVSANIVRQTPTVAPECDECIIMRWPWIIDLRVRRVHQGSVALGSLTVLTVQHTDFRSDVGSRRWLLRRNTLGGFNVVYQPDEGKLQRCSADMPAAMPYIRPADGQTLDDLRREGEKHYGRDLGS